ncbi:hypothetical protein [Deinococcus sp. NW-56]|uniref:GNAT family N-acetyltransferase n=1 Tax=Deinococcus sp. NW-56 TaxID=2080419 RepID=UPI001319BC6F|nr:hypothetical protein [Deinococcus sp. NW-56]
MLRVKWVRCFRECTHKSAGREGLAPDLWPPHPEAEARVRARLERELAQPERFAWFLAERGGEAVGVVSAGLFPAPPVYQSLLAGLSGDELYAADSEVLAALLDEAETFLRERGAAVFVTTCPARASKRLAHLTARGYQPLTLWMTRPVDPQATRPPAVRPATEADLPALVRLNAAAQEGRRRANPRFWTPHPEAPARFEGWMRHSRTLPDRDVLVHEGPGGVNGFVVPQPTGLPPAHDAAQVGTLDDLAADDWATFGPLLEAAHHTLAARGVRTVQAICPADWPQRRTVLEAAGFRTANVWLIKH